MPEGKTKEADSGEASPGGSAQEGLVPGFLVQEEEGEEALHHCASYHASRASDWG